MSWTNVALCMLVSVLAMVLLWNGFDPRVILVFASTVIVSEVFIHLRWKLTLPCPHCAFDPLLYKRNRSLASAQVKAKLDAVKLNGGHLLKANNPFQYLPSVIQEDGNETDAKSSGLLSKRI